MKKYLLLLLLALMAPFCFAQSYPSPTYKNLTVTTTFTATGLVTTADLAVQAANTVLANVTAATASPTAVALPTCSTSASALNYTSGTGFTCNTAVIASNVSGVVAIANGGTNATTATQATTNLQYNQGNSGAVTRSDTARLQDYVSVKDFGATGNGVTDDTTAINTAIGSGFFKLYFPTGTYNIAGTISTTVSGVSLVGSGKGSTILSSSCATCDIVLIGNGSANPGNDNIEGMSFTSSVTRTAGSAIHVRNGHNITMSNLVFNNQFWNISLDGGTGQFEYYINNFEINGGAVGILVSSDTTLVQDTFIHDGVISSTTNAAIYIINSSGLQVRDVDLISNNIGVTTQGVSSGLYGTALVFDNVQADTSTLEGFNFVSNGGNLSDVRCVNCWGSSTNVASSSANGFVIQQFSGSINGINLIAPHAINNGGDGIFVNGGTNIFINNFQTFQNSVASTGTKHGIEIGAGASNFSIIGGQSGDGGKLAGANKQAWGVLVNTGASNNYQIVNVNCGGNLNGCVSDNGTGANKTIGPNINH